METAHPPAEQGSLLRRCCGVGAPLVFVIFCDSVPAPLEAMSCLWHQLRKQNKSQVPRAEVTEGEATHHCCCFVLGLTRFPLRVSVNSQESKEREF